MWRMCANRRTPPMALLFLHSHRAIFSPIDQTLDFGRLAFRESYARNVMLTNTGRVPVQWRWSATSEEGEESRKSLWPSWLVVEPKAGFLLPGEIANISVACCIAEDVLQAHFARSSPSQAAPLNFRVPLTEVIVFLRIVNGQDFFVRLPVIVS